MCGIAGYLSTGIDEPVGRVLLDMLTGLARRGPDSAGIACFRGEADGSSIAWVRLPGDGDQRDAAERQSERASAASPRCATLERHGDTVRLQLWLDAPVRDISRALERPGEDFEVVSLGEHLELVKQVGAPAGLDDTFGDRRACAAATASATRGCRPRAGSTSAHSQPFWAHGVADLATVHNGHITNYHKLRRLYEQRGVRFFTENDSEVIGVYLADQLDAGLLARRGAGATRSTTSTAASPTSSPRRTRSATPAIRSRSSR